MVEMSSLSHSLRGIDWLLMTLASKRFTFCFERMVQISQPLVFFCRCEDAVAGVAVWDVWSWLFHFCLETDARSVDLKV